MDEVAERFIKMHTDLDGWVRNALRYPLPLSETVKLVEIAEKRQAAKEIAAAITAGLENIANSISA